MDFEDFRDLFHWYVPEYDYRSPLSEMDKWHVLVNVGLILAALGFGLFCKIKHRWLVNAKCAFCNCVVRVWRARLHWWFCNNCQRINGYPESSLDQNDSSSVDEIQELKDDSFKLSVRNNKIQSPSNPRKRLLYSKNDLNEVSAIVNHSPKVFQDTDNDLVMNVQSILQDENNAQTEVNFQKIKNKIEEMLKINRDIEQLSDDAEDDFSADLNRLPFEMRNLRKIHMKLILDDVNRRFELLKAERMLCAKMKEMKELEKSLRDAKENAARDNRYFPNESFNKTSHSIRRRNTFFKRTLDHSISSSNVITNKELNWNKYVATARSKAQLSLLESHLTELRDMHANEIALLKSQIENKSVLLKKIEYIKFGVGEFFVKAQEDQFTFDEKKFQFDNTQELPLEKQSQILHNNSESGYLSESVGTKSHLEVKNAMPVIAEENLHSEKIVSPHHVLVLKKTFERFKQDNEHEPTAAAAKRRRARIVKPIRSGQRPAAACSKVVLNCSGEPQ